MKSFIKYYGGKSLISNKIISMIPPHKNYIEVFCGASWLLFNKPKSQIEVINDIDNEIINLYLVIKNQLESFKNFLNLIPISETLFSIFNNHRGIPILQNESIEKTYPYGISEKASMTYYNLMNSFNGKINKKPSFSFDINHRSSFYRFYNTNWNKIKERLIEVTILNRDFREIIKKYDSKNSFFYLDPPYTMATDKKNYYKYNFNKDDHNDLMVYLKELEGNFILSYDNNDKIKKYYKEFNIKSINNNELLIYNFDIPEKPYFSCRNGIPKEAAKGNWKYPNCPYCSSREIQQVSKRITLEENKRNWVPCGYTCRSCGELFKIS